MDLRDRPVDLAVALTAAGARMVVVGGVARRLRGSQHRPRDLDVVVAPADLPDLVDALRALGVDAVTRSLLRSGCSRLETSYGLLDVFVGRAPSAAPVLVAGVELPVAA